jgi:hypothetical protein
MEWNSTANSLSKDVLRLAGNLMILEEFIGGELISHKEENFISLLSLVNVFLVGWLCWMSLGGILLFYVIV